ncbi:MAG TPA: DUF3710 domain-containing protein [Jiangellaceae bacterium]|nr:DUF3710 domain-containing protein [Jiangellaceae bacterium]
MFRRRRRRSEPDAAPDTDATVPASADAGSPDPTGTGGAVADEPADPPAKTPRPDGPLDLSEVDPDEPGPPRVDLGGIRVRIGPRMQLQVQVDERSGIGTGVRVVHEGAAVLMVAVAAPRSSGLWGQTRLQVAAEARRRGGTVTEAAGPFGTEVRIVVPVRTAEGKSGLQPSRVVGIDGPRWMLRATFLGTAISDPQAFARLVKVVREVVVVRGDRPMAPGDVIPVTAPTRPEQATPEVSDE